MDMVCKCGGKKFFTEKHGNQIGLYCSACGKWQKWLKKDEIRLFNHGVKVENASLLERLNRNFPDTFRQELMVTAYDVKHGKPSPEPYLMALEKAGLHPNEAIVVENAPMGVHAGVAAGIFTVAVNTGPLPDRVLLDEGANLLLPSMLALSEQWEELYKELGEE